MPITHLTLADVRKVDMIDTIDDVEPPYRSGNSDKVKRTFPPMDARIEALIADFEDYVGDYPGNRIEWTVEVDVMRALIAQWRAK
jgi:hypothetical protein